MVLVSGDADDAGTVDDVGNDDCSCPPLSPGLEEAAAKAALTVCAEALAWAIIEGIKLNGTAAIPGPRGSAGSGNLCNNGVRWWPCVRTPPIPPGLGGTP